MIRTQVYIPEKLYKDAKLYAQIEKKSISQLIRDGLETNLYGMKKKQKNKTKKNPLDDLVGILSAPDADPNAAINHNDIYDI